uniref:N-acetylmuramoyl-L-alanine amidase n=1 Tax=Roseihalotalea indica TaxID=2867963 RepID=A0AA49GN01_9BACT|nr:N-acetylmuramoyl-L-alanine amidase [Tunicatimonas sp. TK19036]
MRKPHQGYVYFILFLLIHSAVWAQNYPKLSIKEVEKRAKYYQQLTAPVEASQTYQVNPKLPFTSLAFRAAMGTNWADTYVIVDQDTFRVQAEEHETEGLSYSQSTLLVWDRPVRQFLLHTGSVQDSIILSLFNAQTGKTTPPALRQERVTAEDPVCEKPTYIPQDEWRAGLPPPSYSRSFTQVEHVIIHHSATYNNLTDYENIVRNIYLFHTQDRGWSDIGYNFLVAPDGTLFEGRSAGSQNIEPDNIQGAHFCGRNSGTMGVCMLGNYNTVEPTDTALATIIKVTSWKLDKENLDPLGIEPHPANSELGVIAGHRNGCSTECPGDNLYARLEAIRTATEERISKGCRDTPQVFNAYPVPTEGILTITLPEADTTATLTLIDLQGQELMLPVLQKSDDQLSLDTSSLPTGMYIVEVRTALAVLTRKILVQ